MTKATFNKILKKYQEAGVAVTIISNELLSSNYQRWNLRFQNGTRLINIIVGHNIANDEIAVKFAKSNQPTDIYRVGSLLGLKFIMEI